MVEYNKKRNIEWGFDLTDFGSAEKFKKLLRKHNLVSGYKREKVPVAGTDGYYMYTWSNKDVKLITANNPITGIHGINKGRRPQKGYASYIGIVGEKEAVKELADDIRKMAATKDESMYERVFI